MDKKSLECPPQKQSILAHISLFLFLGVAFVVRFPYIFVERLESDEALYAWCAKRITENLSMLFSPEVLEFHPPLFSLLLSFGQLFFPPLLSDRVVVLVISLMGIFFAYQLGQRINGWFLGLFCSLNLIFNYNYLLVGSGIYPDVAQMLFCVGLILLLMRVNRTSSYGLDLSVGCMLAAVFLVKWSGIVLIGYSVLYYLYIYREAPVKDKLRRLIVAHTPVVICALVYYLSKFIFFGTVLPDVAELTAGGVNPRPFYYYLANIHNIFIVPYLIIFFCIGFVSLLKMDSAHKVNLLLYFVVVMTALSVPMVKNIRYALILLPVLLVIAGMGVEVCVNALKLKDKSRQILKGIVLVLLCLSHLYFLPRTRMILERSFSTGTGFAEAGEWIKLNADPGATIISQNKRPLRYFTGINYKKFGGSMVLLPPHKEEFELLLSALKGPVILQVDLWSESNPSDYAPFSARGVTEDYFKSLGFSFVKDVEKYVYTNTGMKNKVPVVKIYEKK